MIRKRQIAVFSDVPVWEYTLTNQSGMELSVLNYGGTVRRIVFPDRLGRRENRVLAYRDAALYEQNPMFFGALIGRVAGRIAGGAFALPDGVPHRLEQNESGCHLHGGSQGFHRRFWNAETSEDGEGLHLTLSLRDEQDGYPGNLAVRAVYSLGHDNAWTVRFHAETDAPTLCNMTQHTYFCLDGMCVGGDICEHMLSIRAEQADAVDAYTLPTGDKIDCMREPAFKFSALRSIGAYGMAAHAQQQVAHGGYDHAFALKKDRAEQIVLYAPQSGVRVAVSTSEEAVVVYTCNKVDTAYPLENGQLKKYAGVTLETQALPDRVHSDRPELVTITPKCPYDSFTRYAFSLET